MLTGSAPKRHSACLASAVERCFRLLPRDLRWSALSTLLEAQMITGKTAVSLVARGGTTDCAVSPVHNVFDAPPPHARLPGTWSAPGQARSPRPDPNDLLARQMTPYISDSAARMIAVCAKCSHPHPSLWLLGGGAWTRICPCLVGPQRQPVSISFASAFRTSI